MLNTNIRDDELLLDEFRSGQFLGYIPSELCRRGAPEALGRRLSG